MSVEILDGATIVNFLEDEEAFNVSVRDRFAHLDSNHDGQLSYEEMLKELQGLRFDHDLNGTVDLEEFKAETRQMMLAMANGMGFLPVQMVLEEDSFLKKAVEWESAKLLASHSSCMAT
ncbi:CALCIUM-BINDING EF-HAND FAMILY PROTEIN-LIKE [Salix purpurea]|uniref:CALCIUM-BINDING EF-HAND FAMILY PROTEIN-LIKE n=1 Tax=Salix purpurea TaxID=77065 RepID=A0A9Q0SKM1_SALPP|nr:CALCIUM-BINDING EF-HAND FAMILY PROTEIN-LIKE [Salix purpurea]